MKIIIQVSMNYTVFTHVVFILLFSFIMYANAYDKMEILSCWSGTLTTRDNLSFKEYSQATKAVGKYDPKRNIYSDLRACGVTLNFRPTPIFPRYIHAPESPVTL